MYGLFSLPEHRIVQLVASKEAQKGNSTKDPHTETYIQIIDKHDLKTKQR